jgi:hypothetical protein
MKGKNAFLVIIITVVALGATGYFTGVIEINLPGDNSNESKTEYLTIYINSYNFTQILLQDFMINYTIDGFGTFDLFQNKSVIGATAEGAEGLKIYDWCSLNFTPAADLKDLVGVNDPIASQPGDEEEDEEPMQARPRPYCWEFDLYDTISEVNIILTVIISFGNVEARGVLDDFPPNDPRYLNYAETYLQIQLSKNGAMILANEISADDLTGITSVFFKPDIDWGFSNLMTEMLSSSFMITNAEGQVVQLELIP